MRRKRFVLVSAMFFISIFLFGCSYYGFVFGIPYGAKYDSEMSYIMGRFYMTDCVEGMGTIFIRLKNMDTKETYDVGFNAFREKNVLIRAIAPGRYKIDEFFFRSGNQADRRITWVTKPLWLDVPSSFKISESAFDKFSQDFKIRKGSICYLGDFCGYCKEIKPSNVAKLISLMQFYIWEIGCIVDNYAETVKEFGDLYTNFKGKYIEKIFN